jgi:hypothetical protein
VPRASTMLTDMLDSDAVCCPLLIAKLAARGSTRVTPVNGEC